MREENRVPMTSHQPSELVQTIHKYELPDEAQFVEAEKIRKEKQKKMETNAKNSLKSLKYFFNNLITS
jgi:hypothetical protein